MKQPQYRVILTVDIEDYSSRSDTEQRVLQTALMSALGHAADAAELNRERWKEQLTGDGLNAMLPPGTDIHRLLDVLVRQFDAQLGLHNRLREQAGWARIRVRLAVHVGPVHLDGDAGWPGQHAVLPVRLRDSQPVRTALAARPDADLAVIVSNEIYQDYVTQGVGDPRPTEFREVRVRAKKQSYIAYLHLPRFDVHKITELDRFDPEAPPEEATPAKPRPPGLSGGGVTAGRDVIGSMSNRIDGGGNINIGGGSAR